jgi:hypothetical protein
MSLVEELQRIADEAARTRRRLEELSRVCAELRQQLSSDGDGNGKTAIDNAQAQRLQSVS